MNLSCSGGCYTTLLYFTGGSAVRFNIVSQEALALTLEWMS